MSGSDQHWRGLPIFRELFLQWRAARLGSDPRKRPFSRDWEQLLQDAQLTSADLRREAHRDANDLAADGLVELKTHRLRPYQIDRIAIPLAAESRLREIFADELPIQGAEPVDLSALDWTPKLQFLRESRTNVPLADLQALDSFLKQNSAQIVPIKERSLQIFGDEKRLDALLLTTLFRPDRLTLEALGCRIVAEPLAWKRGKRPDGPVIVLENAATWHSYCRWDSERHLFSAIVYGCGNRFRDGVAFLQEIFNEIGGSRTVRYFGDLDVQGVRIPLQANLIARALNLPVIEPDLWSYRHLLALGRPMKNDSTEVLTDEDFAWFGVISPQVRALLHENCRLAQESIGWDFLREQTD